MRLRHTLPPLLVVAILAGLFISRVGLVLHEFVGHGGVARAFGGRITDYHLFFFGGGRIHYVFDPPASRGIVDAIALGGIVLETTMGTLLALFHRRPKNPLVSFVAFAAGAGFLLHALFYLVDGTHYGYGDARFVHELLGPGRRWWLVAPGVAVLAAIAFFGGHGFATFIGRWLGRHSRKERIVVFVGMLAIAGGVHVALTRIEVALTPDETYARIFASEANERAKRLASRELDDEMARLRASGQAEPSDAEKQRMLDELAARHRPFPPRPILYALLGLSIAFGLLRKPATDGPETGESLGWPAARRMAVATSLSLLLVAILHAPW